MLTMIFGSKTHSSEQCLQAIRKSLKGNPAIIAYVWKFLSKLKRVCGTLRCSSSLLSEYYRNRKADIAAWSQCLEVLSFQLCEPKSIPSSEQNDMLRARLRDGLTSVLNGLAVYVYDASNVFDELRLCLRPFEFVMNKDKVHTASNKCNIATRNMVFGSQSVNSDIWELSNLW